MIASIAYAEPSPAIDGNQIRVLSRIFWVDEPARSPSGMRRILAHALALIDPLRPGDFNQALMDIGASVCKPKNPRCEDCPAAGFCLARAGGRTEHLPILPEKQGRRVERRLVAVVLSDDGRVLVRQRPEQGLLAALWELPGFPGAIGDRAGRECLEELGLTPHREAKLPEVEHVFTHLVWKMWGRLYRQADAPDVRGYLWVTAGELLALPMPSAMKLYREEALRHL